MTFEIHSFINVKRKKKSSFLKIKKTRTEFFDYVPHFHLFRRFMKKKSFISFWRKTFFFNTSQRTPSSNTSILITLNLEKDKKNIY